jgi:hypothetical protein
MAGVEPGHDDNLLLREDIVPETIDHLTLRGDCFKLLSKRVMVIGVSVKVEDILDGARSIARVYEELDYGLPVLLVIGLGKV